MAECGRLGVLRYVPNRVSTLSTHTSNFYALARDQKGGDYERHLHLPLRIVHELCDWALGEHWHSAHLESTDWACVPGISGLSRRSFIRNLALAMAVLQGRL